MTSRLINLTGTGKPLVAEPPDQGEFDGLVKSASARLIDATNNSLSLESRFDLAYNSGHAFCLAALRWHGYRARNRYIVYQVLPDTLGLGPEVWRILARGHEMRNRGEYEGELSIDDRFVEDLINAVQAVATALDALASDTGDH